MPADLYSVLANAMRYWFLLLGVLIVVRSVLWQWRSQRRQRRRLRKLPDAGMIGALTVLRGSEELPEGAVLPLPYEGVLGFVRTCDVPVPCNNIAAQHLDFSFQPGLGLLVYPRYHCPCLVDGVSVTDGSKPRRHPLVQGSILTVGEAQLTVCLFDGFAADLPARAVISDAPSQPMAADDSDQPPVDSMPTAAQPQGILTRLFGRPVQHPPEQPVIPQQPTLFGQPIPPEPPQPETPERRRRDGTSTQR